jgi:hypothetical protein
MKHRGLTATLALTFLAMSMLVLLVTTGLDVYFIIKTQRAAVAEQQHRIARYAAQTVAP